MLPNGERYYGEWRDGTQNGRGIFEWKNGDSYDGMWEDGVRRGPGVFKHHSGHSYKGTWANNKENGFGELMLGGMQNKGDKYVGDFLDGAFHGQGIYTFANGDRYAGGYVEGKQEGSGTFEWASGKTYHGDWKAGVQHGPGSLTDLDMDGDRETLTGDWENGVLVEGTGKMGPPPDKGKVSPDKTGKNRASRKEGGLHGLAAVAKDIDERLLDAMRREQKDEVSAAGILPKEYAPAGVDVGEKAEEVELSDEL